MATQQGAKAACTEADTAALELALAAALEVAMAALPLELELAALAAQDVCASDQARTARRAASGVAATEVVWATLAKVRVRTSRKPPTSTSVMVVISTGPRGISPA